MTKIRAFISVMAIFTLLTAKVPCMGLIRSEKGISDEDIYTLAQVMLAEAESESDLGRRLVIDTVLNRVESDNFPNDIYSVVYQEGQYDGMNPDRLSRLNVYDDILEQAYSEYQNYYSGEACSYDALYFRTGHYHTFGTPITQEGNHYFSGE